MEIRGSFVTMTQAQIIVEKNLRPAPRTLETFAQPVPLIFDTDMNTDPEDVSALELAHVLMTRGECNIKAVVSNSAEPSSAPCCYAINNAFGRPTIPVGAYQGSSGGVSTNYAPALRDRFGNVGETRSAYPDAVTVYRTVLAAAADSSVVVASVGFGFNLNGLLNSPADGISSLTGAELMKQKLRRIVIMGGEFPVSPAPEWNFVHSISDWQSFFSSVRTEVVCMGDTVGKDVIVKPPAGADPLTDPMRYAYDIMGYTIGGRSAWDELAVLVAVRGLGDLFTAAGIGGTITVANDGNSTWTVPAGWASYLTKAQSASAVAAVVQALHDNG